MGKEGGASKSIILSGGQVTVDAVGDVNPVTNSGIAVKGGRKDRHDEFGIFQEL